MARTSNEFGGGEIVPAIEAITGIQAPVMADFQIVPNSTVIREDGSDRRIQNQLKNLKSSSGIERIPFNGIDELDTEFGFINASAQILLGGSGFSVAQNTATVAITNSNGASGTITLTFTPSAATVEATATAFATAFNESTDARLSEYTAGASSRSSNSSSLILVHVVNFVAKSIGETFNMSVLTVSFTTPSAVTATAQRHNASDRASVYAINSGDSRIRFIRGVENWSYSILSPTGTTPGIGVLIESTSANSAGSVAIMGAVEVTFFGTALNMLAFTDRNPQNWLARIDGGELRQVSPNKNRGNFSQPDQVDQTNNAFSKSNNIIPIVSGLDRGVHTVTIYIRRHGASASSGGTNTVIYGCEFINANTGITQQPGADFDGRVEALAETTFPIKPDNSTVPSADRAGNAAVYTNSSGISGIQGARVLNYLTSGGQYKQVFNTVDAVIATGGSTPVAASIYTLRIDGPGSGTGTTTSTITIPDESTTLSLETFGAGGDGGNGVLSGGFAAGSGGGGGGGAYANASYTKTGASGDTLAIVVGAGSEIGNVNNTTITGGGALSGSFTVNAGIAGVGADPGNSLAGTGGAGGTVPGNANITGLTVVGMPTLGAGNSGTDGEIKFASGGGDGNVEGGQGGLPGNQSGNTDNGGVGVSGTGGTGVPMGGPGEIPGGGGGGGGASFSRDGVGGQGGLGRVTITIRARSGLSESSFGSNVSFPSTLQPVSDGLINLDPGSAVNGEPLNVFADASHGNQEVIRRINFREFGVNNNFATLGGSSVDVAFTLDDGTTTLVGNDVDTSVTGFIGGIDAIALSEIADFVTLTFVGTGLDIFGSRQLDDTVAASINVEVDGFSIGNLTTLPTNFIGVIPIVSGLAYGTHTVKFQNTIARNFGMVDFIIYGPKKPEIPTLDAGSLELSDYNIMADYSASNLTSGLSGRRSKGVLGKSPTREFILIGGTDTANLETLITSPFGYVWNMQGQGTTAIPPGAADYTFYGTGMEIWATTASAASNPASLITLAGNRLSATNFDISVDGGTRTGTGLLPNVDIRTLNSVAYDTTNGRWQRTAGTALGNSFILQISGLDLKTYTLNVQDEQFTGSVGDTNLEAGFVITPIHINDDTLKVGSEGLNNLTIDPVIEEDEQVTLANLGEAKAWIDCMPTGSPRATHNISAVIRRGTGQFTIYFDKPFKSGDYVVIGTSSSSARTFAIEGVGNKRANSVNIVITRNDGANLDESFYAAFFGELIDE